MVVALGELASAVVVRFVAKDLYIVIVMLKTLTNLNQVNILSFSNV